MCIRDRMYVEKQTGVTFRDVAGQEEAKESLQEVVDFLHNPGKYTKMCIRDRNNSARMDAGKKFIKGFFFRRLIVFVPVYIGKAPEDVYKRQS